MKPRKRPKGLLIGGLIVNIGLGGLFILILLFILLIYALITGISVTIGGAIAGQSGAEQAADNAKLPIELTVIAYICIVLAIYSAVAIPITIVALVFCCIAKNKKMALVAGILAIVASLPSVIIPLELIGGIKLLKMEDKDFVPIPQYQQY